MKSGLARSLHDNPREGLARIVVYRPPRVNQARIMYHVVAVAGIALRSRDQMSNSRTIAGLIGPALIAITLSEALNLRIWAASIPAVVYLNGTLLVVAGLAVVRVHNFWTRGWPVVVTLMGWLALLGGLFRMFVPQAQQGGENIPTYVVIATLFAIGCFLTFKAYGRK